MKHSRTYKWIKGISYIFFGLVLINMTGILWGLEPDINKSNTTNKGNEEVNWYGYWPQAVTLNGRLMDATTFGAPNYGENPKTDKVEKYYYLILDKAINVKNIYPSNYEVSPYMVGEIDVKQFKKEYTNQYGVINDVLRKNNINPQDFSSLTNKELTDVFNELIQISNLLQLLEESKKLSGAKSGKADNETVIKNKKKLGEIYPLALVEAANKRYKELKSETERNVTEVQLVIDWMHEKNITGNESFKEMMQKNVIVSGTLFHSFTGHHHEKVLITVTKLRLNK